MANPSRRPMGPWMALAGFLGASIAPQALAQAVPCPAGVPGSLKVCVRDDAGQPVANGFRWLLEEDNTYGAVPGVPSPKAPQPDPSFTLGVNIHRSHAPTVCAGDTAPANAVADAGVVATANADVATIDAGNCPAFDPARKYMVSVLPWHTSAPGTPPNLQTGWGMSGRNVAAGQTEVAVVVHAHPMPTAQITVFVFNDNQPINAAFDQPAESGLPGFGLLFSDPIGKTMQDAWTNPIGTTYRYKCPIPDPNGSGLFLPGAADAAGNCTGAVLTQEQQPLFELDGDGLPVVDFLGDSTLTTCPGSTKAFAAYTPYERANCVDPYTLAPLAAGEAVIRFLPQNKYTVEPIPPGADPDWILTGTIEGTRGNDSWVRAAQPRYNVTLGQINYLIWYGFVRAMDNLASLPNPSGATGSIHGHVVFVHDMHPPLSPGLSPGLPVPYAYVGVNNLGGNDEQVYTAACDPTTGEFTIGNVPPGTYNLTFWDKQIQAIIDFRTVVVPPAGGAIDLGNVAVFGWFGNYVGSVFGDTNQNGFRNASELGIANIPVNLHFTDGSLYGSTTTDADGNFSFPQVFPFWRYFIADVDFLRLKPTGVTAYVDNGGPLPANAFGAQGFNPQRQPNGQLFRTQAGPVVTQAMQLFQDMTNRIDFGKAAWAPGENGGIHGFVNYAATRTEEDPSTSAIDPWEPAIPRVTVRLHQAQQHCADAACSACSAGAGAPATPQNGCWSIADAGPFPLTTQTDSWDDAQPTGCVGSQGQVLQGPLLWTNPEVVNGFAIPSCAETFYNWNQIRPGVMDGTYWFRELGPGRPIPPGNYIVEVVPPAGYEVLKWGDRDIEFGDPKIPYLTQPPPCVGPLYTVPRYHTLFPDQQVPTDIPGGWTADGLWTDPQAAGCEQKLIALNPGANPEVDFNLFTQVPKAARIWGTVWNDLMLEFNPKSPNASGNFGVPWLPVAIKDWKGVEVARFYTDQWGHFDGLVPANYDIAPPIPLGVVLATYSVVPNDPGPILDASPASPTYGQMITDPWFDPEYSQAVSVVKEGNWEFYSGKTTFIDTIVLPVAAFVGNRVPLNCDYTDHTPEIRSVSEVVIPQTGGYAIAITAMGNVTAPNPNYDPNDVTSPVTVTWDHGFSSSGTVTVGGVAVPATFAADGLSATATIPDGREGQLVVTRGDNGLSTTVGVTLRAASASVPVITVNPPAPGCSGLGCRVIQPAIDAAPNGAVVVLQPGTYQENVNLWKPLTLQGKGAAVTVIDGTAAQLNLELSLAQSNQVGALVASGAIGVVPGQASDFVLERGAGILVAGCNPASCPLGNDFSRAAAGIDGLTVTGASQGGGILVNGYVPNFKIANNEVFSNQGSIAGGIRVGESALVGATNPTGSSFNPGMLIDHNRIALNGSIFSGAGGIALYAGSDGYRVTNNMICGNFSFVYGGGIGHYGLSDGGLIADNKIVSNESFDEGGGIHVGGELPPAGATTVSLGAGSVAIRANLIQGNKAGDDGGGVRTRRFNGEDVAGNPGSPGSWYHIDVLDNLIVNNSSADHGGGISLDDTVLSRIVGNTVADNDSTATGSDAFGGPCTENSPPGQVCPPGEPMGGGITTSIPQVAGISSIAHSAGLYGALTGAGSYCAAHPFSWPASARDPANHYCADFSNPQLVDDIIWGNRSYYWNAAANGNLGALVLNTGGGHANGYWDMAVNGTAATRLLSPSYSVMSLAAGIDAFNPGPGNLTGSAANFPRFAAPYFNAYQATSKGAALGNFVVATFTPNGIQGNYHIQAASPASNAGSGIPPATSTDFDGQSRNAPVDIGADEIP